MQTPLPADRPTPDPTPPGARGLRAVDPVDLLSYVQHVLGYTPRDSLTAIALAGRDLGAVLRCDYAPGIAADLRVLDDYVRSVAGHLAADDRADGSLVFLFRDTPDVADAVASQHDRARDGSRGTRDAGGRPAEDRGPGKPGVGRGDARLAAALGRELAAAGLPVAETWLVAAGRLWHVDCAAPSACSFHGADVRRTQASAVNAAFIVAGSVVQDEPRGSGLPAVAPAAGPELLRALEAVRPAAGVEWTAYCARWLEDWERVLDGAALPVAAGDRARLLAGLASETLRDVLVAAASFSLDRALGGAEWLGTLPEGLAGTLGATAREADAALYSSVLMAASLRRPDWERIARLRRACAGLLPEAAGTPASAARSLVAWVDWARGRGSSAGRILQECRREDPAYPLARVLEEVVDRGMLAGWAARRETSWSANGRAGQ
ncbi:DUF4192 family protein [Citricoccus sp. SGAir0253]|uniref:DUF4192 family protein n=1 Tax=Citricoccus sp. SGAir0253 TaxID=2567881 RepID=UPI0010CD2DF6|nr:DUF4192 family protein [Citricoccus sp. SGAir0253]QCU77863.1 DUF4192 family protein [Citricoccus sp. SGAir0253]